MEIEPDLSRVSSISGHSSERSGLWWVVVVAIGVLLGNSLSFAAQEMYQRWQLKEFMVAADAMLEKQQQRSTIQQAQMERDNAVRESGLKKQKAVNAHLQQTCTFWRQQVLSENTEANRNYRDIACARVNGLFR